MTPARKQVLKAQLRAIRNLAALEGVEVIYSRYSHYVTIRVRIPYTCKYEYERVSLGMGYARWKLQMEVVQDRVKRIMEMAERAANRLTSKIDHEIVESILSGR